MSASGSWAAENQPIPFNNGSDITIDDLPPGFLKSGLQRLPPAARARALEWLNNISFPATDIANLRVDSSGGIFYADDFSFLNNSIGAAQTNAPSGISAAEVFSLHSKPGASTVLFVDVDGHVISNTAWNGGTANQLYAQAFNSDGDPNSFSPAELDQIAEMWYRIAEDFSMFDVDVTTEDPIVFGSDTGRILITPNVDANGVPMPYSGAGGVAYVNVFGQSNYEFYSPALVYSNNLSNFPPYIAEAASHEAGHNLGLTHDGTSTSSYYPGHGSGAVSWGPIMGTGYNDNVSQWSKGDYADANNAQDDIGIIAAKMGLRGDDHGDSASSATVLQVGSDGNIDATTPQNDPFNVNSANKGFIGSAADVDYFTFSAGDGPVNITITPSWLAWLRLSGGRGTNLDVEVTLYDVNGEIVDYAEPNDETNAVLSTTLSAGNYYLRITGTGNLISPYPQYGSQGQYYISGNITVGDFEPDETAPTPDPMLFASLPAAIDDSAIVMTASQATDESGSAVQYFFASPTGGNSGWISQTTFTATGLDPSTSYSWSVKARDAAGNETAASDSASATTNDTPVTPEPPAVVDGLTAVDNADGGAILTWNDVADETSYEIIRESYQAKRNRWRSTTVIATLSQDSASYTDTGLSGQYRYRIRSINNTGSSISNWVEVTVAGKCKGGPRKCGT